MESFNKDVWKVIYVCNSKIQLHLYNSLLEIIEKCELKQKDTINCNTKKIYDFITHSHIIGNSL